MGVTLSASRGYGAANKPWVARILGTDRKFGLNREFVAGRTTNSKSGKTGSLDALVTTTGLYEACSVDGKGKESSFYAVLRVGEELESIRLKESTAHEIADALEAGRSIDDLIPVKIEEGKFRVRKEDGTLNWKEPEAQGSPKEEAIRQIKLLMQEHGVSLNDLMNA